MCTDDAYGGVGKVKALVLLIGLPAAGKSYISSRLVDESSKFACVSIQFDENITFGESTDFNVSFWTSN